VRKQVSQETPTKLDLEEAFKRVLQGLEVYAPLVPGWLEVARGVEQQLRTFAENAMPSLVALAQIDWAAVKQRLDELPEKSKAAMSLASSKGWFFGWNDSLQGLMKLVEKLEVTQPADIDKVMAHYYRTNLESLTDELVNNHPDRARVIKAAVRAHTTLGGDGYFLSIPVFIAQADGLLTEITKVKSALMRDGGQLQASRALREKLATDQESLDLLHPLLTLHDLDFMKSAAARQIAEQASGESFTALNRHQVMHGESWDYGTEINSLKAFSFLVHVGAHLPMVLKHVPQRTRQKS
jgi:hypothetical protein